MLLVLELERVQVKIHQLCGLVAAYLNACGLSNIEDNGSNGAGRPQRAKGEMVAAGHHNRLCEGRRAPLPPASD